MALHKQMRQQTFGTAEVASASQYAADCTRLVRTADAAAISSSVLQKIMLFTAKKKEATASSMHQASL